MEGPHLTACRFCQAETETHCDWPVDGFRTVYYRQLETGDHVHRLNEKRLDKPPAMVLSAYEKHDQRGYAGIQVRLLIKPPSPRSAGRVKEFWVLPHSLLKRQCQVPCAAPCCELHHRDVGEVYYCKDHWRMGLT